MKRFFLMSFMSLSLTAAGLTACDDDSSSSSELPSLSGSDPNKAISEVTTAEAKAWCEQYKTQVSAAVGDEFQCTIAGLTAGAMGGVATMAATCATVRDECLKDPSKVLEEGSDPSEQMDCEGTANEDYKDCDATVAEFDACFSAMLTEEKKMADKISCDMTLEEMMALQGMEDFGPDSVPACAALKEKCPEVFEDDSQIESDTTSQDLDLVVEDASK